MKNKFISQIKSNPAIKLFYEKKLINQIVSFQTQIPCKPRDWKNRPDYTQSAYIWIFKNSWDHYEVSTSTRLFHGTHYVKKKMKILDERKRQNGNGYDTIRVEFSNI